MRSTPVKLGFLLLIGTGSAGYLNISYAGCPFFTRPHVENDDSAIRLNSYAAGSWVCYQDQMHLCQSSGAWKPMGNCSSYQQVKHACEIESTDASQCGGRPSLDTAVTGSSAGSRGSAQREEMPTMQDYNSGASVPVNDERDVGELCEELRAQVKEDLLSRRDVDGSMQEFEANGCVERDIRTYESRYGPLEN